MRKMIRAALLAVGGALILLIAILAVRTWQYTARRPADVAVQQAGAANEPVDSAAVARLSEAVRFRTVTYSDSAPKISEFKKLHAFLERAYPLVHTRMTREVIDSGALLFTWRGTDTTLAPVLLMGHQDVVPVEPGTEKNWKHGPFSGADLCTSWWAERTRRTSIACRRTCIALRRSSRRTRRCRSFTAPTNG
ncbi:MAG TPA: hypothetical protein VIF32_06345 [Gemmatimonadaceae bacterium]